jgi:hypothetical protein
MTNTLGNQTSKYWEAWQVPAKSEFTIYHPIDNNDDTFSDFGGTKVNASARFYEALQLPSSFIPHNPNTFAGELRSTTMAPNLPTDNATTPVDRTWTAPQ